MKLNRISCRTEGASALAIVLVTTAICAGLALGIVVNRSQSMKLATRRQQDELANLDSRIQAGHVKGLLTQMVQSRTLAVDPSKGTIDLSSPLSSALGQVLGNGSVTTTDDDGNSSTAYAVAAMPSATPAPLDLLQYTPSNAGSFQPLTSDSTDPLSGIQTVRVVSDVPIEIDATPAGANTVFYAGQRAMNTYSFREVPLSVYSLYANGATVLSPDVVQDDAGRVYVNGSLTINGAVTASRPLVAQGDIQGGTGGATLTVNGAAQGGTTPSETVNLPPADPVNQTGVLPDEVQQMQYGNLVMGSGVEGRGIQVLPASNFNDLVSPTSNVSQQLQLGRQCEFRIAYTPPASSSGNGAAQVYDKGALLPEDPASFADQVRQDSDEMNQPWDDLSKGLTLPDGFRAALTTNGSRLVNPNTNQPIQFVVLDYKHIPALQPNNQTFYIPGDPSTQAVLLRGGATVDSNKQATGQITDGKTWNGNPGFSLVTNLDIYVYQGIAPAPGTNNVAISLITSGIVHAVY